jgi:hypothetical protein
MSYNLKIKFTRTKKELKESPMNKSRTRNGSWGPVAQWIEHSPSKRVVVGSTPTRIFDAIFL